MGMELGQDRRRHQRLRRGPRDEELIVGVDRRIYNKSKEMYRKSLNTE